MSRWALSYLVLITCLAACFHPLRAEAQSTAPADTASGPAPATERSDEAPLDFTNGGAVSTQAPAPAPPAPVLVAPPAAPPPTPILLPEPEPMVRLNAVNLSVLGFVIGNVRVTYERMLVPKHGVFGEVIVAPDVLRGFDFVGVGAGAGYRFHWHGEGTSGFVGASVSVMRHSGTTPTIKLGSRDTFDFSGSAWTLGISPHVGKRWLFARSGVNLTLRVGGGFAYHVVNPDADSERKANRNLKHTYLMTDGELSVGYSF